MVCGDERYFPEWDRGSQWRYVRDWVDSCWYVVEWIMLVMVVVLLFMFVGIAEIQVYSYLLLWVFVVVAILDMVITLIRVKRAVRVCFGENWMEKGLGWYAVMCIMQMCFLRIPKFQVA